MVRSKRFLSLITGAMLVIGLFGFGGVSASAATKVGSISLKSDIPESIHIDEEVQNYLITSNGDLDVDFSPIGWHTYADSHYSLYESPTFSPNTYYYIGTIRLKDSAFEFADVTEVRVNGEIWSTIKDGYSDPSLVCIVSPAYTVPYGYGTFELDLFEGETLEYNGDEGLKITDFVAAAIKEKKLVKIGGNKYSLDSDNTADVQFSFGSVGYIAVSIVPGASVKGPFEVTVSEETMKNYGYSTYNSIIFVMPGGAKPVSPYDLGTIVIDLSAGDKSINAEKLTALKNTVKRCPRSNYSTDISKGIELIDLNGDNREDIVISTASSDSYTFGTFSSCLSMYKNCTNFQGNKYDLVLSSDEARKLKTYGENFYSAIIFKRPTLMNIHNLGSLSIDMRGNKSIELAGDQAAFLLSTILYGDSTSANGTYIHRTVVSESKAGSTINLDIDCSPLSKGDDVVLDITTTPELVVKISPLPGRTVPYSFTTELSENAQEWFTNEIYHAFYKPVQFIFDDDPGTPPNPDNPDNPGNPQDPSSASGGGINPAPTVQDPASSHKVGDVVKDDSGSYVITSNTEDRREVTYTKPESNTVTSANIPAAIAIDGQPYKVTAIAAGAFKNNKKLKKITIGANINKIGKKAFYKCKNLKTIKVKTTTLKKSTVGSNAFKGIHPKAKAKVPKRKLKAYTKIFKARGINGKDQKITK